VQGYILLVKIKLSKKLAKEKQNNMQLVDIEPKPTDQMNFKN
jgi:hypothetical protein